MKPIYGEGSFTGYIKTEDIYIDIDKDVKTRFDTWNYELESPLPRGKMRKKLD